jgi:hypothetical protein
VLGDDRADWQPDRYNEELWGCGVEFRFPIAKLLDWADKAPELENHANPFAVMVLADLMSRATQRDVPSRKAWKFRIVRVSVPTLFCSVMSRFPWNGLGACTGTRH